MAMTLRVVVPPHPLIAHWLTMLRNVETPPPLYATALGELGKWLTYEALRDWIPHRREEIKTHKATTEGIVIESSVPLLAIPLSAGGFEMWHGGRTVLPNASLCLGGVPKEIERNAGVIVFIDQIAKGETLLNTLKLLKRIGVESTRIRVIAPLASAPGLSLIGESSPDLNIYTGCIDPEINDNGEIIPGIGNPILRLNTRFGHTS